MTSLILAVLSTGLAAAAAQAQPQNDAQKPPQFDVADRPGVAYRVATWDARRGTVTRTDFQGRDSEIYNLVITPAPIADAKDPPTLAQQLAAIRIDADTGPNDPWRGEPSFELGLGAAATISTRPIGRTRRIVAASSTQVGDADKKRDTTILAVMRGLPDAIEAQSKYIASRLPKVENTPGNRLAAVGPNALRDQALERFLELAQPEGVNRGLLAARLKEPPEVVVIEPEPAGKVILRLIFIQTGTREAVALTSVGDKSGRAVAQLAVEPREKVVNLDINHFVEIVPSDDPEAKGLKLSEPKLTKDDAEIARIIEALKAAAGNAWDALPMQP